MNPKSELLAQQLELCRAQTVSIAGKVPEAKRLLQLQEGKAHPMWLLGHLANTANVVMLQWTLNGESLTPKGFGKKFAPDFGGGDPIVPDASVYPSWDEVLAVYDQAMSKAIEGVRTLNDADLPNPVPGRIPEPLRTFFSSVGMSLSIMVSHDSYHRGQMGMLGALK